MEKLLFKKFLTKLCYLFLVSLMGLLKGIMKMVCCNVILGVLIAFTGHSAFLLMLVFSLFITVVMIEEWYLRRNEQP